MELDNICEKDDVELGLSVKEDFYHVLKVSIQQDSVDERRDTFLELNHSKLGDLIKRFTCSGERSVLCKILKEFANSSKWCHGYCRQSNVGDMQDNIDIKLVGEAFNWLTDYQLPTLFQSSDSTKLLPARDVFLLAVMDNRTEWMEQLWKDLDGEYMATALIASTVMKKIAEVLESRQGMYHLSQVILGSSREFEKRAANILQESFKNDPETAPLLLVRRLEGWDKHTVLSLAYDGKHRNFMSNDCCQSKLKDAWYGEIPTCTPSWRIVLSAIFPLLITCSNMFSSYSKGQNCCVKAFSTIRFVKFYHTPIIRFTMHTISYLLFLCVFGIFMIDELPSKSRKVEYVVWVWAGSLYLDEMRQLIVSWKKARYSFNPRVIEYFNSSWNLYDQLIFWLLVVGALIRYIYIDAQEIRDYASDIYAIAFVTYVMRLLQYFYVVEAIGPKITIMYRMVKDFLFFLFMFALFLIAFGVAFQALVHPRPDDKSRLEIPSNEKSFEYFNQIIYVPFFVIFQQFGDLEKQISSCLNSTSYTLPEYQNGKAKCSHLATSFYVVYVLIAALLLVNLLIASFSSSYEQVAKDARKTWLYYNFEIICEYIDKPTLPPPFIFLNHLWRLAHAVFCCRRVKQGRIYQLNIKESKIEKFFKIAPGTLKELEKDAFDRINRSDYEAPDDPHEDELTSVKVTLKRMMTKLDRLKNSSDSILSPRSSKKVDLPSA